MRGSDACGEGGMGEVRRAREQALGIRERDVERRDTRGRVWKASFDTRSWGARRVGHAPVNRRTRRP
jgi:hypothetical protein